MDNKIKTPHIIADKNAFSKIVIMPGDPKRAKMIADTYLTDIEIISDVRGIVAYKGIYMFENYTPVELTIMASGMGMPSMGIYSHELYNFFDVDMIIRVGTAGGINKKLNVGDLVIAQAACTNSNYSNVFSPCGIFAPISDFDITRELENAACNNKNHSKCYVGNVLSSDVFYAPKTDSWENLGVLAVEMEAAALFTEAALANKKAAAICTISDLLFDDSRNMTAEQRQNNLHNMIRVALDAASAYYLKTYNNEV